jgi:hypothetical protein
MSTSITFRLGAVAAGSLLTAMFATGLLAPSTGWAETTVSEVVGLPPDQAQVAQSEGHKMPTDSLQLARAKRPAAKQESPEDLQHKQLPKAAPPGELKRASKADLINECNKQPKCRAEMQAAKSGKKPKNPRPAAREESPEEKAIKQLPQPAQNAPGRQRSQSDFLRPTQGTSLLGWLNPFGASEAFAQSTVSVHLDPQNSYNGTPYSRMYGYGVIMFSPTYCYLNGSVTWTNPNTEDQPYAYVFFQAPAAGYYIIDFKASRGRAKLRHQSNGPIIDTWDLTSQSCYSCDYATMEYLEQGNHYLYFWPDGNYGLYLYSVDITSYP